MLKIILSFLVMTSASLTYAAEPMVFPNAINLKQKEQCVVVTQPCKFNTEKTCEIEYCGTKKKEALLEEQVANYGIIGKRFQSVFDIENYLKAKLSSEFSNMHINVVVNQPSSKNGYNPNRINVVLDSQDYIIQIYIG